MPITSNGQLSLTDISTEFGGNTPHSMSEYWRGGLYVANVAVNANVPTVSEGNLSFTDFYNSTNFFVFEDIITDTVYNYDIKTEIINAGWDQTIPVIANVVITNSGAILATNASSYALYSNSGYPTDSQITIRLHSNAYIVGYGGYGSNSAHEGKDAGNGYSAILLSSNVYIYNDGKIAGGGGGGGSSAKTYVETGFSHYGNPGGGGAGNGERGRVTGGQTIYTHTINAFDNAYSGSIASGGNGAYANVISSNIIDSGPGGSGGNPGMPGKVAPWGDINPIYTRTTFPGIPGKSIININYIQSGSNIGNISNSGNLNIVSTTNSYGSKDAGWPLFSNTLTTYSIISTANGVGNVSFFIEGPSSNVSGQPQFSNVVIYTINSSSAQVHFTSIFDFVNINTSKHPATIFLVTALDSAGNKDYKFLRTIHSWSYTNIPDSGGEGE